MRVSVALLDSRATAGLLPPAYCLLPTAYCFYCLLFLRLGLFVVEENIEQEDQPGGGCQ
jgi:hypothetical protein